MIELEATRGSLAAPFDIRGTRLKNRLVVSPMCVHSATDGSAGNF